MQTYMKDATKNKFFWYLKRISWLALIGYFSGFGSLPSGNTWHLMINQCYHGRLRRNDRGWVFDGEFKELADDFGESITKASKAKL